MANRPTRVATFPDGGGDDRFAAVRRAAADMKSAISRLGGDYGLSPTMVAGLRKDVDRIVTHAHAIALPGPNRRRDLIHAYAYWRPPDFSDNASFSYRTARLLERATIGDPRVAVRRAATALRSAIDRLNFPGGARSKSETELHGDIDRVAADALHRAARTSYRSETRWAARENAEISQLQSQINAAIKRIEQLEDAVQRLRAQSETTASDSADEGEEQNL